MIIGLSGTFASGKDTLAHFLLQNHNFMHVSTGDMVRAVAEAEYGNTERPTLVKTANELREKRGPGVLAELAIERYELQKKNYSGIVISGVRSLGEANVIQAKAGIIVFTDAPVEVRFERIKNRQRAHEEQLSLEDFKNSEIVESNINHDNPAVQDISGVRELADIIVSNNNNVEAFYEEAEQKLGLSV
ncbi:nucleoside monophosphate kinase [Candidatus Saccharibacteria bacterium]|nr:nucleoside monophosphate kinase [Candidatus Saccharibacteria bacterium]